MPDRILLLSYCFPPLALPESLLSAKRMGALPGFDVDVVHAAWAPKWVGRDHSLDDYVKERFASTTGVEHPHLSWNALLGERFAGRLLPPDSFRQLNGATYDLVADSVRRNRYCAVVTWSQMHSVHLVGRRLRRRFGVPWLAHFSDPWARNPYVAGNALERRRNARLEKNVFEDADRLLFTAVEPLELCVAGYSDEIRAKSRVLPHAFDAILYPAPTGPEERDGPVVLRYLGAFYGPRSPAPLVRALHRLLATDRDIAGRVRVEIVGTVDPDALFAAGAGGLPDGMLTVIEPVSYLRSLALMSQADGLLVVDAPATSSPFLPSKLVDYVGAGRPIASLTPEGPAAELTRLLGGPVADPIDETACASALRRLIDLASQRKPFGPANVRAEYAVETVGAQMAALVRELQA